MIGQTLTTISEMGAGVSPEDSILRETPNNELSFPGTNPARRRGFVTTRGKGHENKITAPPIKLSPWTGPAKTRKLSFVATWPFATVLLLTVDCRCWNRSCYVCLANNNENSAR